MLQYIQNEISGNKSYSNKRISNHEYSVMTQLGNVMPELRLYIPKYI